MRLLRINDTNIDIDDKTAIGLTLQSYDIKQPGKRLVNITNTFTIPATSHNLQIFGFANNPQSTSLYIYSSATCDYWVDNEHLINSAKCRVNSINDRISLFVFQKEDIWDLIKKVNWTDFVPDFVQWLQDNKGLPSLSIPFIGNFGEFIEPYVDNSEGVILPFYYGNLYNYDPAGADNYIEDENNIWLRNWPESGTKADGGHFCIFIKTIFEYLEDIYNVDFLTAGGQALGNIWDDEYAKAIYTPIRDLVPRFKYTGGGALEGFYFEADTTSSFLPLKDVEDKSGKTLHDLVNSFFQHFNIIKDEIVINNQDVIRLARFDDIGTLAEVKDWSGLLTGTPTFKPTINGYAQENTIKFKEIFPEGDTLQNSRVLTSLNKNIDATASLFDIDAYVCAFLTIDGGAGVIPDLSVKESFKTFQFFLNSGKTSNIININISEDSGTEIATFQLQKPALYSLSSEYTFLDEILNYPRFIEVEKWLTISDIKNIEFFKEYFIRELGGSFFINKISGFNPQKSNKATKLELIKTSNRTPITPPTLEYWTDGVSDGFTDGINDLFF